MIEVKGLCFSYEPSKQVLKDINLKIRGAEVVSLLGPNGSGKTTLLKCINGLLKATSGDILINGLDLRRLKRKEIARHIAYVPQEHKTTFPYRVLDVVLLGRAPYIGLFSSPRSSDIDSAYDVLHSMGIDHFADRLYTHLSGGERKLVLIARALCSGAPTLILDEPTSNLDLRHQRDVLRIIKTISKSKGQGVLMTIHDLNLAMRVSDRVLLMKDGIIVKKGTPSEVLVKEQIEYAYGCEVSIFNIDGRGIIGLSL